jgi:hypothetical protein
MAGFFKQLAKGITGSGAEGELNKGVAAVGQGKTTTQGFYNEGETKAQGYIAPWLDRGGRRMYDATLGLSGAGARDAAQDTYLSDPILQRQLALQQKQRGWHSNARGGYGSGADALAASRVNLQGYGDWQNRLAGVAGQELGAAGQAAGISQWGAAGRAGAEQSASNALGNLYQQKAQNANTLAQNMFGLGGLAVQAYTGMPMPKKQGNNIGGSGGAP